MILTPPFAEVNRVATGANWVRSWSSVAPFLEVLGHKNRQRWALLYVEGLLGPGGPEEHPADGEPCSRL